MSGKREIRFIAAEIRSSWGRSISNHAMPYLLAMLSLRSIDDQYGADSGREIVMRFLANAGGWRGDDARRLKAELKAHLQGKA